MTERAKEPVIAALAAAGRESRERAARSLYERGCALAKAATAPWHHDSQLAQLLVGEPTVGVAVRPETFARIRTANGSPRLATVPPDQDAQEFELRFPGGISLDILTTSRPGGPGAISRFLSRRGEAIQQIELPVTSVERATALLRERLGLEPIYPATRLGADGTRVNFFLVPVSPESLEKTGGKVLIELVER